MANVNSLQTTPTHFCARSYRFRDIKILKKIATTPFDGKCRNQQMASLHFCVRSYRFRDIKSLNFYLQKVGQGHGAQFSQGHHSVANVKIYKFNFFTFFIFAEVPLVRTKVTV